MPRKKRKTEKQPLRFLERSVGESRVQSHIPEVRAALNPKDFFIETNEQNGTTLNTWVNPQIDATFAALPAKKTRKCQSSTSLQSHFTQLSRKGSMYRRKFPTLSFETKSKQQIQQHEKKEASGHCPSVSNGSPHPESSFQTHLNVANDAHNGSCLKSVSSSSQNTPAHARKTSCVTPEPSLLASKDCVDAESASMGLNLIPPNIPETHTLRLLGSPPSCTPSSSKILDILVPDTPETDYGVKVTWRRRRRLMDLLKEKGHLSDSETMIHI
ncbi:unnamed protein product [Knipowitschia caucasica]